MLSLLLRDCILRRWHENGSYSFVMFRQFFFKSRNSDIKMYSSTRRPVSGTCGDLDRQRASTTILCEIRNTSDY